MSIGYVLANIFLDIVMPNSSGRAGRGTSGPQNKKTLVGMAVMAAFVSVLALADISSAWSLPSDASPSRSEADAPSATNPKFRKSIRPGGFFSDFYVVNRLAFSPDGRYLAIANGGIPLVVVWDLERDREQSHFKLPGRIGGPRSPCWSGDERLLWSPDGRFITDGAAQFMADVPKGVDPETQSLLTLFDPMTGKVAQQVNIQGRKGVFNRDGSKLAMRHWKKMFVYDTRTWARTEINTGLVTMSGLDWTHDDRVLVMGGVRQRQGHMLYARDGSPFPDMSAVILKIDPNGKMPLEAALVEPAKVRPKTGEIYPPSACHGALSSISGHRVALQCNGLRVLDTDSLETLFTYRAPQDEPDGEGMRGLDFGPDGKNFYVVGYDLLGQKGKSHVVDATTGEIVGRFPSGYSNGVAISPDGRTMAVGRDNFVELFDLR